MGLLNPAGDPVRLDMQALIAAIQDGLPIVARPYAALADRLSVSEADVIDGIRALQASGRIKRFGVVVRHHELGFTANAMVVWDVPDDDVRRVGEQLGSFDCVSLCYRRPRRLPLWPYNLFTMLHGRDRASVLQRLHEIILMADLANIPHQVLFSTRRFKQRGARYVANGTD